MTQFDRKQKTQKLGSPKDSRANQQTIVEQI